jgi:hypothetical protein
MRPSESADGGASPGALRRKTRHIEEIQVTNTSHAHAKEVRRWILALVIPMLAACAFTAASLAGAGAWWILGAIVAGPGFGSIALIWLTLSTDTNGVHVTGVAEPRVDALALAEPTAQ